jgi:DNA-binding PadR family transcriptional regulator
LTKLSPGTLYPMLHAMERSGYLKSRKERLGRTFRRVYKATPLGKEANKVAKVKVSELFGELIEVHGTLSACAHSVRS